MPLIDLKTDLKSLKFGKDRLGGGNSGQPYITSPIPEETNNLGILGNDFLLRGGINAVSDSSKDVLRLGKMFLDTKSPSGILFTAKQNLLSRTAVATQTSGILNEGIYTPLSTLSQAGVNAFGGHLNKQGINPFAQTGPNSNNENLYSVKVKNNQPIEENRLIELKNSILKNPNSPILRSYSGGPGSNLGIGKTNIYFESSGNFKTLASPPFINAATGLLMDKTSTQYTSTYTTTQLQEAKPETELGRSVGIKQDFRAQLRKDIISSNIISNSPNYTGENAKNYETRTNLQNPADPTRNLISYTNGSGIGPVDKINALPIYKSENVTGNELKNDLVKFRIAIIDNINPKKKTFIHFRSFLNSISDSYNTNWNPTKYLGRGEEFYTYSGFSRTVSLSWTVAAQSKEELIPMYKKLNYLASSLTPDYSGNGYMKGNLIELTVGGYFYNQPGIITGMNLSISDDTPYEIGINDEGGSDSTVKELPMIVRVDGFNFTPIHNFRPSLQTITTPMTDADLTDTNTYGDQKYIALAAGGTDNY